ncbi:MAG TPA: hypothetical protein PKA58_34760 [Polyangium sp.]|nr:hypothetical protein [Polyangium sp.]
MGTGDRGGKSSYSRIDVLRLRALLGILALTIATPQCVWTDLDAYSSEYGQIPDAGSGGSTGLVDADSCACAVGQECVNGVCETCAPMWTYDHKALRQGDQRGIDHAYDSSRKTLYVGSARQTGQDPARAYFAEVHTCRGTLLHEVDGPTVQGQKVPGLQVVRRNGDSLFAKLRQDNSATSPPGYAVYDATTHSFTQLVRAQRFSPNSLSEELWSLDVSQAGKVWMYGSWTDAANVITPLALRSDGSGKTCLADYPDFAPAAGRAITTINDDVYTCVPVGTELRIQHFKDSACDIASCNCPVADSLPPLPFVAAYLQVMAAKVVGNSLVVVGFYGKDATDWVGFVAQLNFIGQTWGKPYLYDPTTSLDGFTTLDSDGSSVYAAGFQNYDPADLNTSVTEFLVFGLPITDTSTPKKISAPNIRGAYALAVDGDGFLATGYSSANTTNGRSIRCTQDACP